MSLISIDLAPYNCIHKSRLPQLHNGCLPAVCRHKQCSGHVVNIDCSKVCLICQSSNTHTVPCTSCSNTMHTHICSPTIYNICVVILGCFRIYRRTPSSLAFFVHFEFLQRQITRSACADLQLYVHNSYRNVLYDSRGIEQLANEMNGLTYQTYTTKAMCNDDI